MKNLFLFLTLLVALASPAAAQTYAPVTTTLATNTIAASTTESGDGSAMTLTRFHGVGLQITFQGSHAADTGAMTFLFKQSLDGTTYSTLVPISISGAVNGTTAVCITTNVTLNHVGYLKLDSVQNAATNAVTNLVIKWVGKPGAPFFKN